MKTITRNGAPVAQLLPIAGRRVLTPEQEAALARTKVRREVLVALLTWKGGADLQGALAFAYVHGVGHVSEVRAKEIDALWGSVAAAAKADGGGK